jgi:uncharacterized protein (TIGR02588 family)
MPSKGSGAKQPAVLEWISGGVGLLITLGTLAFLASRAFTSPEVTPQLTAEIDRIVPGGGGFTVEITVRNGSQATAAEVQIEGTLVEEGRELRKSVATLDYVPGHSARRASLVFDVPAAQNALSVRVVGYREP